MDNSLSDQGNTADHRGSPPQAQFDATEIFAKAAKSVVQVSGSYMTGSGFFVSSDVSQPYSCEIATIKHIADEDQAIVITPDGKQYSAKAELLDSKHQISIYKLEGVSNGAMLCPSLPVESKEPADGEPIFAVGAKSDVDESVTAGSPGFGVGAVEHEMNLGQFVNQFVPWFLQSGAWREVGRANDSMPITLATSNKKAMTFHGYSGGPWLNASGSVVGITDFAFGPNSVSPSTRFLKEDLDRIKDAAINGSLHQPLIIK